MKLYHLTTLLFLFHFISGLGQTEIATINEVYKNRVIQPDEAVPLVDEEGQRFALMLFKGKVINGYLFDKTNTMIGNLVSEEKARNYRQILGKTILKNNDFVVFMTNKNRKKFASSRLSFQKNEIEFNELDLDLANEKILQTADFNNKFHVITITPRTALINIYRFEDATTFTKFPIDFSNHTFLNDKQKETDLYDMITINSGFYGLGKEIDLVKIETVNPTSLEVACNPTKLYQQDELMILTFDSNEDITQIVEINLESLEGTVKVVKKAMTNWAYKERNSNSFLCDDLLYQIVTTKRVIHLRAQNYRTGDIINEYSASENEKITFKNSPIAQTGGAFDNYREFQDTGTLLRKVRRGKAGLSVHKSGDLYQLTYGGVIERQTNPGMMMPGFGIPIASVGAVSVFFNPAFFAYESYTHTKALFVDALFNSKFEHQTGEINENVFDRIETFEEESKISPVGRTVFKLNNSYVLGNYQSFTKTYTLRSF
ncbi:MAG: hypothetical protein AB8B59_05055 [Maribacter sp.]